MGGRQPLDPRLQRLMRHTSYQTTQKFYINPTNQMQDAITDMPSPEFLMQKQGRQSGDSEAGNGK